MTKKQGQSFKCQCFKLIRSYDSKKHTTSQNKLVNYLTFEITLHFMNNLRLHNVSITGNPNKNQLINECAKQILAKISYSEILILYKIM